MIIIHDYNIFIVQFTGNRPKIWAQYGALIRLTHIKIGWKGFQGLNAGPGKSMYPLSANANVLSAQISASS